MQSQLRDSLMRERLMATLSGFFGALAALIATIGLYGVMSYMVARRRNEIGIRMALGADRREVVGMVMREAGRLLGAGVLVGLVASIAAARAASDAAVRLESRRPADAADGGSGARCRRRCWRVICRRCARRASSRPKRCARSRGWGD